MHQLQQRQRSPAARARRGSDGEERAPHPLLALQRQIGNRAVARLVRTAAEPDIDRIAWDESGPPAPTCVLTTYGGSTFTGEQVVADREFVPALEAINHHAADNDVNLLITDSFRPHGRPVRGAIVPPASRSNHLAGHAIDMNVMYGAGKNQLCNSRCLGRRRPPAAVKAFIDAIKADDKLRWGGDFSPRDPVHIDDGLNGDDAAWQARFKATQQSHRDGCP
ncbi:MAG TPA: M15 family metallopeptidase [Thermomicrobiales bacterium]|nr:M15 family metallopeptidase [Thermomicrobiales bacterium]